eukprot:7382961-Prymnesium_polylepis.1
MEQLPAAMASAGIAGKPPRELDDERANEMKRARQEKYEVGAAAKLRRRLVEVDQECHKAHSR